MALLAFISNGGENTGRPVYRDTRGRRRNPVAAAGPALSLLPYPPFVALSLGTLGWANNPGGVNPVSETVVLNPYTEESRRYPLSPEHAVYAASGGAPVGHQDGWVRSGEWVAPYATNPPRWAFGGLNPHWSYMTLDLIYESRRGGLYNNALMKAQVRLQRPVLLVDTKLFVAVYARNQSARKGEVDPGRLPPDPGSRLAITAQRMFERWKATTRDGGLERLDAYDVNHPRGFWFAMDIPLAYDIAWVNLGSPHPLETALSREGGGYDRGYAREIALLQEAEKRARYAGTRESLAPWEQHPELVDEAAQHHDFYASAIDTKRRRAGRPGRIAEEIRRVRRWYNQGVESRPERGVRERAYAVAPALGEWRAEHGYVVPEFTKKRSGPPARKRGGEPTRYKKRRGPSVWGSSSILQKYDAARMQGLIPSLSREEAEKFERGEYDGEVQSANPKRKRNRDSKWKRPPETYELSVEELAQDPFYAPGVYALADKKYKRFHQTQPTKAVLLRIPDGKKEVTRDPDIHVVLHETLEKPYRVTWESQKRGEDPNNPTVWFHEFPEGSRPLGVLNPRTGIVSEIGGSYLVDDYYYS